MMTGPAHADAGAATGAIEVYRPLFPFSTIKAVGRAVFRSREARDYACLLDLDPEVVSWQSVTHAIADIGTGSGCRNVDFKVETTSGTIMVDVCIDDSEAPDCFRRSVNASGFRYMVVRPSDLDPIRVQNARDLIRYARYEASLGDRVRVLAALEEMGALTLAECMSAVREGRPMDTVASLILRGHINVDIDEKLLGPDTTVRHSAK